MPDLIQMKTFVLIAEFGSFAAAARELAISPAAVSKQITRLEGELRTQLLNRSTRHVELTEIGKSYFEQCKRVINEFDAASAIVGEMQSTPRGVLKVVSGRHFGLKYIVPYLNEFLNLYPDLELNLELAERIPDVRSEAVDVIIGMSISAAEDMIQKRIATTHYVLCASPNYLERFGRPVNLKDLVHHRYITHSMREPHDAIVLNDKRIKLKPYLRVNDAETMKVLALEGIGLIYVHDYVVHDQLQTGSLEEVFPTFSKKEIPLYVAYQQKRFTPTKVQRFIDFVSSKIKISYLLYY